jgi:hypothetical protein
VFIIHEKAYSKNGYQCFLKYNEHLMRRWKFKPEIKPA